ncbi:hypothetical protein E4U14_002115 [Claviceps sp. LM454 group G7]|nr:hypothetical protein E4U14_002115 [Claviceps sp. LM454 group G7]
MRRTQNTLHQADGAPPPPYSESNTYTSSPRTGLAPLDDAASCISSFSSSSGTGDHVIYTPPMTPRTSSSAHHYHNSPQQNQMLRAQCSASATRYFDSRRVPTTADISLQRDTFIVGLHVQDSSVPGNFPYQDDLAARDVTRRDWAIFLNFLLPGLATRETWVVWERELRAEGTSEHDAAASSMNGMEPQLDTMREEHPVVAAAARRRAIRETVQQWNDQFFGPRGIHLVLEQDFGPHVQQEVEACTTSLEGLSFDDYHSGILPPENSKGTFTEDHKGASMGQDQAGQEDGKVGSPGRQNGGPNSDNKAFSQDTFGNPPASMGAFSWSMDGNSGWCRSDRGEDLYSANDTPHGHPGPGIFDHPERGSHEPPHYESRPPAHAHEDTRGRPGHSRHDEKRPRALSTFSTASSVTSSFSASSSVGSLPDYNDIQEHQLPLYAARLQDWASHPEQIRTKREVEALKSELKSLKTMPGTTPSNQGPSVNKRALKGQIKALQAQWRGIKKTQRQSHKTHKRERRQRRRAEKQERRQNAKEVRRAYKDLRKGRTGRGGPGPFGGMPAPPVPVDPQVISAMAMATATATSASSARLSQSYASRRGSVRHSQHGSYFMGPQGMCGENFPMGGPGIPRPQRPLGPFGAFGAQGFPGVPGFAGQGHPMHPARPSHPMHPMHSMHWFPLAHPTHPIHPMHPWGPRNYDQGEHPFCARGPVPFMDATRGSGYQHNDVPGAWPNDDFSQAAGISGPAPTSSPGPVPGPASAAKYRIVASFEDQVRKMTSRLASLEDGAEKASLQKTTDELVRMTDRLRREADEVYARDLACAG